jgi:hypothetical protein
MFDAYRFVFNGSAIIIVPIINRTVFTQKTVDALRVLAAFFFVPLDGRGSCVCPSAEIASIARYLFHVTHPSH